MLVVNFIPMLLGYLLKVIMFRHRGFGNDYAKGYAEAKIALPNIKKPKFTGVICLTIYGARAA